VVDVGAAFPVFGEAAELVEQGEGLFHDPAHRLVVVMSAAPADQRAGFRADATQCGTCRGRSCGR
jgi:hypothetical protein